MAITDSIKQILSVKIKPRHDSYTDQFSRIFMVKVMMIGALLVGLNWYSDKISCIIPGTAEIDGGFVGQACWINGLYVYEEIRYHENEIGYYGIPRDISNDGIYPDGTLCNSKESDQCRTMEKTFYVQYQYMTFVLAALAVLYYAPYCMFRLINQDIVSLKGSVKGKLNTVAFRVKGIQMDLLFHSNKFHVKSLIVKKKNVINQSLGYITSLLKLSAYIYICYR